MGWSRTLTDGPVELLHNRGFVVYVDGRLVVESGYLQPPHTPPELNAEMIYLRSIEEWGYRNSVTQHVMRWEAYFN